MIPVSAVTLRAATGADLPAVKDIYNQGIEDRVATLETQPRSDDEIAAWFEAHGDRHAVLVADVDGVVSGWASLNPFSHRCAHAAIADLSVYVAREKRGRGIGRALLEALVERAREARFHKIVLHAVASNEAGTRLYRRMGFREVGVFKEHGELDGAYVDVVAMERILA